MPSRPWLLRLLLLMLAAVALAWLAWLGRPAEPARATPDGASATPQTPGPAQQAAVAAHGDRPEGMAAAAEPASAAPASQQPRLKPVMSEADWAAFDREWCAAMQPAREALRQGGLAALEKLPPRPLVDDDIQAAAGSQLLRRLSQALAARASPRERAVGLWLAGREAELLAEAQATRDPVIVALAAQRLRGEASAQATRLWRELEPTNMVPLLHAQAIDPRPAAVWLESLASATAYEPHLTTVFQILHSVPAPTEGSPAALAQDIALVGLHTAWPLPEVGRLLKPCRRPDSAPLARQCAAVAERLWALKPNDTFSPHIAFALVRAQPALRPAWEARARHAEAMAQLEMDSLDDFIEELMLRSACLAPPAPKGIMSERLRLGNAVYWSGRLPTDPAALDALVSRHRAARGGKSLLDALPAAPTAASAPARP